MLHSLPQSLVSEYNEGRRIRDKSSICHAPFNNIYFNIYGQAAPCWLTLEHCGRYPEQSLREIWTGPEYTGFRERIRRNDLSGPCHVCDRNIRNRVFGSALARAYD